MEDIALTFNPTMFLSGLNAINKGIQGMNANLINVQKQSVASNNKTKLSASNIMGVLGKIGIAFAAIKGAMRHIPEIGRTFSIAGDIFMRNFLWPLRKFLVPILQKVLDWVRDNRAMFVRWGSVVANVFRALFGLIKQIWDIVKKLWESLSRGLENIFGRSTQSITDLANLVLFKITAVIQFILVTLEPVFRYIVRQFVALVNNVKEFFDSFIEGLGDIMPDLGDMWESLSRIGRMISNVTENTGGMIRIFRNLGYVLSMVVGPIIRGIGQLLDGIASGFEYLAIQIAMYRARGNITEMRRLAEQQHALAEGFRQRTIGRWGRQAEAWSGSVQNIQNSYNNTETETPANVTNNRNRVTTNNRRTTTNNNIRNNVNININESQTPRATGNAVRESVEGMVREQLFRAGGR